MTNQSQVMSLATHQSPGDQSPGVFFFFITLEPRVE